MSATPFDARVCVCELVQISIGKANELCKLQALDMRRVACGMQRVACGMWHMAQIEFMRRKRFHFGFKALPRLSIQVPHLRRERQLREFLGARCL